MDISYLLFLQELRNSLPEWVAIFFKAASDFVVSPLFILIPCLFYWCIDKRRSTVMLFAFGLGDIANELLKTTFCVLRPWMRDPRIEPYGNAKLTATGYSFPSGHVQWFTSIAWPIAWVYRDKRRWALPLATFLTLIVALSRNFLGVHTPQDVLVGMLVGILCTLVADRLVQWVEGGEKRDAKLAIAGASFALLSLLYVAFKPYPALPAGLPADVTVTTLTYDSFEASGFCLGTFLGWFAERRLVGFESSCTLVQGIVRILIGLLTIHIFRSYLAIPFQQLLGMSMGHFFKGFLTVIAAVFVAPWLFTALERRLER